LSGGLRVRLSSCWQPQDRPTKPDHAANLRQIAVRNIDGSPLLSSTRLSLCLASSSVVALASIPFGAARAEDTKLAQATAKDLGVMAVNLKDVAKLNHGFQGALQGAGTPNEAGLSTFIPLKVSKNSVAFVDVLVNANFNDYGNYSGSCQEGDVSAADQAAKTKVAALSLLSSVGGLIQTTSG